MGTRLLREDIREAASAAVVRTLVRAACCTTAPEWPRSRDASGPGFNRVLVGQVKDARSVTELRLGGRLRAK
jgi:hypothetical protein